MKKTKLVSIIILFFILILSTNFGVYANSDFQEVPYSEAYQEWLKLSDEEKENVLMPRMYDVQYTKIETKNPLLKSSMLNASANSSYSLQSVIANNLTIRNQQQTNSCWAFAALSSLETNLALSNYKNNINKSKVYDFSERHMEYATSREFLNDEVNPIGYNRQVGSGGTWDVAISYLTNGSGAINESEMPFENNEDKIALNQIQGKTVTTQVYDTIEFADYNKYGLSEEESAEIINQIKNHIQNYGAVFTGVLSGSRFLSITGSKLAENGALSVSTGSYADHGVSIIGWDDNYDKSNWDTFEERNRPKNNGAWIVRNSWGEDAGDNGLIYVSYEDKTASQTLYGIIKASDKKNYDNIYQYDYYYPNIKCFFTKKCMICNIFEKKTNRTEYLKEVSLYVPEKCICKVFVNLNSVDKSKNALKLVQLKAGESETLNPGYHTLEFANPLEIKSNKFAVSIEIYSTNEYPSVNLVGKDDSLYSEVKTQPGRCYMLSGYEYYQNDDWSNWVDLGVADRLGRTFNSTIKGFTTYYDGSLTEIRVATPPTKMTYWVGENFDKTGMVVKAYYNEEGNPSKILKDTDYSITNGTALKKGQTSVTISYQDKTVMLPIEVNENKVESIQITTPPTKTEYFAGDDFNKTGMVVKATYTNGTVKEITDYTITNGTSLKNGQNSVTISYSGKTANQTITVKANTVEKIEITHAPDKVTYVAGQNFDKTGMIVKATYSNKTVKEITDYEIKDGKNLTKEQKSITVTYEGKTVSQNITVVSKSITGISVKTLPSKLKYIQNKETLDLTGGVIKVTYNDNSSEEAKMTSSDVTATGFDNTKVGKITIKLSYQSKSTQFEVEVIQEVVEKAENSNMDKAVVDVKSIKSYSFTKNPKNGYTLIGVEVKGIQKNTSNDKLDYYYYLSANKNETNITGWNKIEEKQNDNNVLKFTINTKDINNYNELANANVLYLYVKEVATKGGNQSVLLSSAMKFESDVEAEAYLDNSKVENKTPSEITIDQQKPAESKQDVKDDTVVSGKIPQTGVETFAISLGICMVVIAIIVFGIKVRKYNYKV